MTYRVLMRPTTEGFDAWAPDFPGLATTGATEEEAVRNIQKSIRGRLDLELEPAQTEATIETTVNVTAMKKETAKPIAIKPENLPGPMPFPGLPQLYMGLGIFVLGIVGVVFFFTIEPQSSPFLLFAPFIVLALGALGLFFGAVSRDSEKKQVRN